jgi:hypothetical protein
MKPSLYKPKQIRTRKKSLEPESKMQESCFTWFRYQWPEYAKKYFAIPNGGKRDKITAARMKKEGQMPGVHDTFLMVARHGFSGLWIEMKIKPNGLSEEQETFWQNAESENFKCALCYSLEEFISIINSYLSDDGKERNQPNYRLRAGEH